MRYGLILGLGIVLLTGLSGCGGPSTEELTKELTKNMNDALDAMQSVKDDASADAAITKLDDIAKKMSELKGKLAKAKPDEKAQKQFKEDMEKMQAKGVDAVLSLATSKASNDKQKQVIAAFEKVGKSLQ